jgi:hypothetical protein
MKTHRVSVALAFCCITIVLLTACGKGTDPQIPGVGNQVPLVQVDGHPLPTTIVSSASDQTAILSGKATLGEAIATGQYAISLRHTVGSAADTSVVSGTTLFAWNGSSVTATIDLGATLGTHTFLFFR